MRLRKRILTHTKADMAQTLGASYAARTVKLELDGQFPIDCLYLYTRCVMGGSVASVTAATTPVDSMFNFFKRINVGITDRNGKQRTVIDTSGSGLVELQENWHLGRPYNNMVALSRTPWNAIAFVNSETITMLHKIPFAHPLLTDPLRTRTLLPAHVFSTKPLLTLDIAGEDELSTSASFAVASFAMEVIQVSREMPAAVHNKIMETGGYIDADILENEVTFGVSTTDLKIPYANPAKYTGTLIRSYTNSGGAQTRGDCSDSSNPYWSIEAGGTQIAKFRLAALQQVNQFTKLEIPGMSVAHRWDGSYYLDFLSDDQNLDVDELGSVLDTALGPNVETVLRGAVTQASDNAKLKIVNHRFLSDISPWLPLAKIAA